jgi:hypothetical protein
VRVYLVFVITSSGLNNCIRIPFFLRDLHSLRALFSSNPLVYKYKSLLLLLNFVYRMLE